MRGWRCSQWSATQLKDVLDAYAQRDVWSFGEPGVVEVRVVPRIESSTLKDGAVTPEILAAHQTNELIDRVTTAVEKADTRRRSIILAALAELSARYMRSAVDSKPNGGKAATHGR